MTAIRAIFCFSYEKDRVLFFEKRFPTVEKRASKIFGEIAKQKQTSEESLFPEGEEFSFSHLLSEYVFTPLPSNEKFILDENIFPVPQSSSPVGQIPPTAVLCHSIQSEILEKQKKYNLQGPIWPVVHIIRVNSQIPFFFDKITKFFLFTERNRIRCYSFT